MYHYLPGIERDGKILLKQDRSELQQEQLPWHWDRLQLHVDSAIRLHGAGSLVIKTGFRQSSFSSHPWPTGDFRSCIATIELLQVSVW